MVKVKTSETPLAKITVPAEVNVLPAVISFVREIASFLKLKDKEIKRLELVVEEACMNVIDHAFDPDEKGNYDVLFIRELGKLVIAIEDQGLPFDIERMEKDSESGLGMVLMKAFADEINFLNKGKKGKRVEIVKYTSYKDIAEYLTDDEKERTEELPSVPKEAPVSFRMLKAEDAVSLSRCVYRSYGYSYIFDFVYYPDKIQDLLDNGLLESVVAVNSDDEVIGQLALTYDYAGAKVGESGKAIVDPRYRGRSLFKKMKDYLIDFGRKKGMYGIYSESVTIHPYTQKGNITLGASETGIILALIPEDVTFKKINEKGLTQRQSLVLFYLKLNEAPERDVYIPIHHKTIITKIYEKIKIKRNFALASDDLIKKSLSKYPKVDVKVFPDLKMSMMRVVEYGQGLADQVKFRIKELCLKKIEVIYLDLPLSNPSTQKTCVEMEKLGFFFSGIIPELVDEDVLRLQFFNNIEVDPDKIVIVSDFAKELLSYIMDSKK